MNPPHPPTDGLSPFYRKEGGCYLIEIKLSDVRQLFNSLDPSPFIEKDLDEDAEAYIVQTATELPIKALVKLVVHLPTAQAQAQGDELEQAVRRYFDYRYRVVGQELRQKLRNGRKSLAVGLTVLFLSIAGYKGVGSLGDEVWWGILAEGLMIGGWVAMWRPLETFLYDWWPIERRRKIYDKLRVMAVEVREIA